MKRGLETTWSKPNGFDLADRRISTPPLPKPARPQSADFDRKSPNEIKAVRASMGMRPGMDIPGWPLQNIEEMAKKLEQELLG